MYDDAIVRRMAGSIKDVYPATKNTGPLFDWFLGQMATIGIHEVWIRHSRNVGEFACSVAEEYAGRLGFTPDDCAQARTAGYFHDIGKILGFVGKDHDHASLDHKELTDDEWRQMNLHPLVGCLYIDLIDPLGTLGINREGVLENILFHHLDYSGGGYPDYFGLKGD
jgi:HD-GYP domain-containing protein (c-di-GMP phosphodiesterase class II)